MPESVTRGSRRPCTQAYATPYEIAARQSVSPVLNGRGHLHTGNPGRSLLEPGWTGGVSHGFINSYRESRHPFYGGGRFVCRALGSVSSAPAVLAADTSMGGIRPITASDRSDLLPPQGAGFHKRRYLCVSASSPTHAEHGVGWVSYAVARRRCPASYWAATSFTDPRNPWRPWDTCLANTVITLLPSS